MARSYSRLGFLSKSRPTKGHHTRLWPWTVRTAFTHDINLVYSMCSRSAFRVSWCSSCGDVRAYSFAQRVESRETIGLRRSSCTVRGVRGGVTSVTRSAKIGNDAKRDVSQQLFSVPCCKRVELGQHITYQS